MIKTNKLILAVLLTFPLFSYAQADFDSAVSALNKGDYEIALKKMLPLANAGNAKAQNMMGFMYFQGFGVDQSYSEAVKWYRKSSDQGFADAQANLGLMYQVGQGVQQDFPTAFKLFQKAADQGYANAQYLLASMYHEGQGCS